MNTLQTFYSIFDDIAMIIRNTNSLSKKFSSVTVYIFLILKGFFLEKTFHQKIIRQTISGHTFYFPDFFSFLRIFTEIFFWKQYAFETKNRKPLVIDCGANIGLASVYFKLSYPSATVICFEPSKSSFTYLQKNLATFNKCTLIHAALVGTEQKSTYLKMPINAPPSYIGSTILPSRFQGMQVQTEKVDAVKLSEYIKKNTPVDFLKIDIEGPEDEVLKNLHRTKKLLLVKEISVEYHYQDSNSLKNIVTILSNNGFKIILSGGIRPPFSLYKNRVYTAVLRGYRK